MKIIKNNIIENNKKTESYTLSYFNNKYQNKSDEWKSYKDDTEYGAIQGSNTYNYMVDCIFRKVFMVLDDINLDKYKKDIQFFIYSLINMKKLNYETPILVNEFKLLFFSPKTIVT